MHATSAKQVTTGPATFPALERAAITVVKLGGRSVETEDGRRRLGEAIADLVRSGARPVIVHGGGAQVTAALAASGIPARFERGLRVTDARVLDVAEPVFAHVGKTIADAITRAGAPALSLTGRDARVLEAQVLDPVLGRVGAVTAVDATLLRHLAFNGLTPVLGPIAVDAEGPLNVNADAVAEAVARALGAKDLILLTDVPGVKDAEGTVLATLTPEDARQLIVDGVATGGMIPKIEGALAALSGGVPRVRVMDEAGLIALARGEPAGTVFAEAAS